MAQRTPTSSMVSLSLGISKGILPLKVVRASLIGECIEAPQHSVAAYRARVHDGKVWVGTKVDARGGSAVAANADLTEAVAA